ncbi:MAG TPA: cupin domain-containing protein [Firmicutes bacterium]|nr:cupin domain-containing protein [Bacillota bacterium]
MVTRHPLAGQVSLASGELSTGSSLVERRLSEVRGIFADQDGVEAILCAGDPVVYRVWNVPIPELPGELQHCSTLIMPGRVGREYFMTKGHYHTRRDTAEVYICLRGEGRLLLETEDGRHDWQVMKPGTVSYIPPYWAHRTVNVGLEPFIFISVYPGDAGHDYRTIELGGFAQVVVEEAGIPVVKLRSSLAGSR